MSPTDQYPPYFEIKRRNMGNDAKWERIKLSGRCYAKEQMGLRVARTSSTREQGASRCSYFIPPECLHSCSILSFFSSICTPASPQVENINMTYEIIVCMPISTLIHLFFFCHFPRLSLFPVGTGCVVVHFSYKYVKSGFG